MGKVIILEDDRAFSLALSSLLVHEGIDVVTVSRPQEALEVLQSSKVDYLLVDCLLPEENGVDFVTNNLDLLKQKQTRVILMSGILVDTTFIKDSLRQTKAIEFLKKPFPSSDLLKILKVSKTSDELQPRQALYQLMSKEIITVREQRKAIEALDTIHGFDLPYIYSLLVRTELSGYLNVVRASGEVFSVTFNKGRISGVDINDEETFLGKLLIESGYILPDDLALALNQKNQKKIGEHLIAENLLSPHGLEKVLSAQMSLRLSRTILDENLKLNFAFADLAEPNISIDRETFHKFLHDWIASKVTLPWLKAHFTRWNNDELVSGPMFSQESAAMHSPLVQSLSDFFNHVVGVKNVFQILQEVPAEEEARAKAIFLLLIEGVLMFQKNEARSNENVAMLLQKIWQQFASKNPGEIRDIIIRMTGGMDPTPAQVQKDFLKLIGSRQDAAAAKQVELYAKIIAKLENSFEQASEAESSPDQSSNMVKLDAFRKFEEGTAELNKSNFRRALDLFKQAEAQDPKLARLNLYSCWAKIGLGDKKLMKEVDTQLMMIPPEDKYDAVYSYLLGLHAKNKNEVNQAKKYFEKALALDSYFIFARRELAKIQNDTANKQDVFNGDIKTIVGNLFNKKKSS